MNDRYLSMDAGRVVWDIQRLRERFPEIEEDDGLLEDMVVGSTEVETLMARLLDAMRVDEAMASGAKAAKADLDARQKRYERRAETKKAMMLAVLDAASLPKLTLPVATFTVSEGRAKAVVYSDEHLPQGFFETVRKPKTAEITKAFLAGEVVPGATLEFGDPFLTIRSK